MIWNKEGFFVSDEQNLLQIDKIAGWIGNQYWAKGRPVHVIEESVRNSLSFGLYDSSGTQLGFARVITDRAVFSWLMDVVIDDSARGEGLGKWLVQCVLDHPDLINTKFGLATKDAHGLYRQFGFETDECMRRPVMGSPLA
ncbi:GNAT family N-acetyltransferase [Metabacillus indicus]|uniref:GNAT family N-acetyltransferase n=1 Tax=Metabacillus indicus TaxID=246786 RepID=UPI0004DD6A12|nr:GNAT family N-acetyltransferase [Metabacillus indicus]KEZ48068.1 hypothetical protein AZ46_0219035 [Metabacillus indicus LMG 22858]